MIPPNTQKVIRKFTGLVYYYLNIWARPSHILYPLTKLTFSKVNFKWTEVEQKLFK